MEEVLASAINAKFYFTYPYIYDKKLWLKRNGFLDKYEYKPEDYEYIRYFFKYHDPIIVKRIKPGKRHIHAPIHYAYSPLYRTPILVRKEDTITINGKTYTGSEWYRVQHEANYVIPFFLDSETRAIYDPDFPHEIITDPKVIEEYEERNKPKQIIFRRDNAKLIDIWNIENLSNHD